MAILTREEFIKKHGREPGAPSTPTTPTVSATPPKSKNLGERTADIYNQSASKITDSITRGADKFNANSNSGTDTARQTINKTGALLESGLGAAAGMGRAVFAPVEATAGAIGDATGIHPVQGLAKMFPQQAEGINSWAQQHPDAARNLGDIITVAGTAAADVGGIKNPLNTDLSKPPSIGGAVNDVRTALADAQKEVKTQKVSKMALEMTKPTLNKKQTIASFEKAGKPGGVTTGAMGKIGYSPTRYDMEVAHVATPYLRDGNAVQSIYNIGQEVERFSEKEITPFLQANPRAVNLKTVEAHLNKIKTPDLFKTDPVLERTYDLVKQKMLNRVGESGGNMEDLWNARKQFDSDVLKEFGDVAFTDSKYTPIRRAVTDMRTAINDFIGEQIGDETFKRQLTRLSRLYTAQERIATSNYKSLGSNMFTRWARENPSKANLIKWGAGLVVGGTVVNGILD